MKLENHSDTSAQSYSGEIASDDAVGRDAAADLIHTGYYDYQASRKAHWDGIAREQYGSWGRYYHTYLADVYRQIVPADSIVLELGCGKGDLLASLRPSTGVGLDLSPAMIDSARERHPKMRFVVGDVHELDIGQLKFDFIILSDLINDLWDVQRVLERLRPYCSPRTRLIFNYFSNLWALPISAARKLRAATRSAEPTGC